MALSLLPQPRSVKTLVGTFDFREVDTLFISKRASKRAKQAVQHLAHDLKQSQHLEYKVAPSAAVKDPHGCLITHHTREGIFVRTVIEKPQGYELLAAGHSLTVSAVDDGGLLAATHTIRQLLQDGSRIPAMKIQDWPAVPYRVIHLDLKGLTPNQAGLLEFVERAALYKFNAILVEYEDRFPYECVPEVRGPHAFTPETHAEFLKHCAQLGLEVIPLVQTIGHLEFLLRHDKYRELAEVPELPQQICTGHNGGLKLLKEMVAEILKAHPDAPFVHLGADEAWQLGQHTSNRAAAAKKDGKHQLYLDHLLKFVRQVKSAGKRAMIWDDMLREMPPDLLKKIPKDTALCYWKYQSNHGQFKPELLPELTRYTQAGFTVYGSSAIKGATTFWSTVPHYRERQDNVDWWVEAAETQPGLAGHVATAWARYNSNLTPCEPQPTIWPSLIYAAERCWTGLGSSRESCERRILASFYGLRPEATEVAQAHYQINEGRPGEAAETMAQAKRSARRNREVLELLELGARLEMLHQERCKLTEQIGAMLPALESGRALCHQVATLKAKLPNWLKQIEFLRKEFARVLLRRFHKDEVDEFIQDRLLLAERMYHHLSMLLKRN